MNIPIRCLQEAKKDKQQFELFAAAVIFKMKYISSFVGKINYESLRDDLHCGNKVAKRIIDNIHHCRFFVYNQKKDVVFVPTFKSQEVKTFGRKYKFTGTSDNCVKIDIKDYTLQEMKRLLCDMLNLYKIKVKQESLFKYMGGTISLESKNATLMKKFTLTMEEVAQSLNLSKSSASRYLTRLADDGIVSKSPIVAECVIQNLNKETASEWKEKNPSKDFHAYHGKRGWSAWRFYGKIFAIIERSTRDRFRHVIWNHRLRKRDVVSNELRTIDNRPD